MKKLILILCLLPLLSITSCEDDDNNCQGIDCLPAATQTGAGTFGCLVNGEPFVDNSGVFNCFYQLVDGEYFFRIGSNVNNNILSQIIIGSTEKEITTNIAIELNDNMINEFYAEIGVSNTSGDFVTSNLQDGTITFSRFNINPNIVSASFEFTITNPNTGIVYNITDGRFDAQFTQ